ncbi:MAG: cohesin domain-containing protein [candidate division Zixibacteria bacterium]|nr:cohesin domain-containing protein [candidate division Zixibacteria bacterium]
MEKRKISRVLCGSFLCLLLFSGLAVGNMVSVSIPDTSGTPGEYIRIPVLVDSILPEDFVFSAEFNLTIDPTLIEVNKDSVFFEGTIVPQKWVKMSYSPDDSSLNIALAGDTAMSGSGALVYIGFKILSSASPGDSSIVHFTKMFFNEETPSATVSDGVLRVISTGVFDDENLILPGHFNLGQNYPNPFNPATKIQFRVESLEFGDHLHTTLVIYNILGQKIRTLVEEEMLPGSYQVMWEGKDDRGEGVPSGVYFYQLKSGNTSETRKMVLMK